MIDAKPQPAGSAPETCAVPEEAGVLSVKDHRILPRRGLVPLHNKAGRPFSALDLRRMTRLCRVVYKTEKIDLFAKGPIPSYWREVFLYGHNTDMGLDVKFSWRTDCSAPPDGLEALHDAGLLDVFLCPPSLDAAHLEAWLSSCRALGLPVRVQLQPPFPANLDITKLAAHFAECGVRVVNIVVSDPFTETPYSPQAENSAQMVAAMNALTPVMEAAGIEANLVGLPLCLVDEANLVRAENTQQFFQDHQQYQRRSYEFACEIYPRRPFVVSTLIALTLGRYTSRETRVDTWLLGWLVHKHPFLHACAAALHKVTRSIRVANKPPKQIEQTQEAYEREFKAMDAQEAERLGPECAQCSLRRICDHETDALKRALPGMNVKARPGELCVSPLHFVQSQPKYYDAVDEARLRQSGMQAALAKQANQIVNSSTADRQFGFDHYGVENGYYMQIPGAITWFSITKEEKRSTQLAWLEAPFTVSITVGGGLADYIGFSLGRHAKILCPMEAYTHKLVLHVDALGNYVLLRDGLLMRPAEFEGAYLVPTQVSTVVPLRLSIWNIDRSLFTQNLLIWYGASERPAPQIKPKYSVIIVSTRFTRRLQAVLRCIAHQQGFDFRELEIIVAYVPGIDATDDLLSSVELAYPQLRIVRSPFPEHYANSKGFVINESMELASGEWILLLDSDILIPPGLFAELSKVPDSVPFVAPDRRKMLPSDTTAKILLGEIDPWEQWQELLRGPGELRVREGGTLPIGFFQCVRATLAKQVKYTEYGHFEGADWDFIVGVEKEGGLGTWLRGAPVLHLDHGGSQWYGTLRHM